MTVPAQKDDDDLFIAEAADEAVTHIENQAQRIAALEAALAAKDEALMDAIRLIDGIVFAGCDHASIVRREDRIDKMRAALALTPPEALAKREAERRVIGAARALRATLETIEANDSFKGIWPFLHVHGYAYSGPEYGTPLCALGEALAALDQAKEEPHG